MIFLQLLVVVMLLVKSLLWGEEAVRGHHITLLDAPLL